MATDRQIAANRRNSQRSTGPRTPTGKAASSANSLKSGMYSRSPIVPGEDPAELEALRTDYYHSFQPANADERTLLDAMITNRWTLNRLHATFHQKWIWALEDDVESPYHRPHAPLVRVYNGDQDHFSKLTRMISSFDRAFHRARTALVQAQKDRRRSQPLDPEPTSPNLASFRQKTSRPVPPPTPPDTAPGAKRPIPAPRPLTPDPQFPTPEPLAPNPSPDIPLTLQR